MRSPPKNKQETITYTDPFCTDNLLDLDLISLTNSNEMYPICSASLQTFFRDTKILREAEVIHRSFHSERSVTKRLMELALSYGISYRTLTRKRRKFMQHYSLMKLLSEPESLEDTVDRYKNCCYYCRDYIIYRHWDVSRPNNRKIFRECQDLKDFSCSKCLYDPEVKSKKHRSKDYIPQVTCRRNTTKIVIPKSHDTVDTIVKRISLQETHMA